MKNIGGLTVTTPSDREIALTRDFDAPRGLVFDAWTKPELLKRWMGPPGWSLVVCEIDLRVGGAWHYVTRSDDGMEMGFGGIYQEIVVPERIVTTEKFDDPWYPGEAFSTMTLTERSGKTTVSIIVTYDSKEIRDMVLQTPMAEGMAAGFDRLDEAFAEIQAGKESQGVA